VLGVILEAVLRVLLPALATASKPKAEDGDPATGARDTLLDRVRETWGAS